MKRVKGRDRRGLTSISDKNLGAKFVFWYNKLLDYDDCWTLDKKILVICRYPHMQVVVSLQLLGSKVIIRVFINDRKIVEFEHHCLSYLAIQRVCEELFGITDDFEFLFL